MVQCGFLKLHICTTSYTSTFNIKGSWILSVSQSAGLSSYRLLKGRITELEKIIVSTFRLQQVPTGCAALICNICIASLIKSVLTRQPLVQLRSVHTVVSIFS